MALPHTATITVLSRAEFAWLNAGMPSHGCFRVLRDTKQAEMPQPSAIQRAADAYRIPAATMDVITCSGRSRDQTKIKSMVAITYRDNATWALVRNMDPKVSRRDSRQVLHQPSSAHLSKKQPGASLHNMGANMGDPGQGAGPAGEEEGHAMAVLLEFCVKFQREPKGA
ncbi:hypothetical protein NDU88_004461 [Pleurodeles waltl]|uniref:Uncharacterized protein n=1 Tax=Pleurodeles waltl TaxID=8319 RepID=A0AAV7QFY1_PLEWA|nr:hypothetical protein NDU88_004461 [Pleurodeles waltl]